ncbi:tetratricopeptide repeat protein [Kordia sp.]|uniref:tetratricopeptide repeat protein n=1 Tax=Kordia sp. TaxID=1965332 RepID=UPI003B58FC40
MSKKNLQLILCFVLLSFHLSYAQKTKVYTHDLKDYNEALHLYNSKQYQASQALFDRVKGATSDYETEANCAYYIANCAVRLNQLGADSMMEDFVKRYPTSTKRNSAYIDVADYYFENGKYARALKWYDKSGENNLTNSQREEYNFKKGYAYFTSKKYEQAKTYFQKLLDSPKYGSQAKYYTGYIAYQEDKYEEANEYFEGVSEEDEFNEKLSYFKADMNFKLGNFQKAIDLSKKELPNADRKEISELNKIIGESYFNLKQYKEAIPYLKEYKGKKRRWNNTDFYQLGYAYYKQEDYENAIKQFNKIVDGSNFVAQNAYYHLGECYLNTDKKQQALNAFRNASQMDFDLKIQEDAGLNYARLSYEIGNPYESVPSVLTSYLKKYPDTEHQAELEELLVSSYITSKDYEAALNLLEASKKYSDKATYQKVAFYRAIELFNDSKYQEALDFFEKSLKENESSEYTARATFWKAETNYLLDNYDLALEGFKSFANANITDTEEAQTIDYNLAYTYFKQKEYTSAISNFEKFVTNNPDDKGRVNDSYLRLGDSHFVMSKYNDAIKAYDKAIAMKGVDEDYAFFQKAISYGFTGKTNTKISELDKFTKKYKKSTLRDDALYELGNTYINEGNTEKGLNAYAEMVEDYPKSSYVPKTMLKQGLINYNEGKNQVALTKFRSVVAKFPNTEEAIQAVATAKLIYVELGQVEVYANWVKNLDFVDVTDAELDKATYESAEQQFIQNNTDKAIEGFEKYVQQFPNGLNAVKANFYLAQSYFSKGETQKTIPHYEYVLQNERNEYTEQALARLAQVLLETDNYTKAIPVLKRLEESADFPQNVTFAQSNLMKANYELDNYDTAVSYAEKVLANDKVDNRIKSDAHVIIARSAIATNNEDKAKEAYAEVQKIATGKLAAEALYYDAYFKNKENDYDGSNTVVQKLVKDYSSYKQFGAKGLIIMAKNFYALEDAFQATYILESVIKNFISYPDEVAEAEAELAKIKTAEAKRNSSVTPTEKEDDGN